MTRDQLRLVLHEEGLTRPQVAAAMSAAERYATEQASLAIRVERPPGPMIHFQDDFGVPACDRTHQVPDLVLTPLRSYVTCRRCRNTHAYREDDQL